MTREFSIPLVLWASAAVLVHAVLGGGAAKATIVQEKLAKERANIRGMVSEVREELDSVEFEIEKEELKKKKRIEPDEPPPEPEPLVPLVAALSPILDALASAVDLTELPIMQPEPAPKKAEREELAKLEPPKEPERAKEEEENEPEPEKKPDDPKAPAELVILKDKRIAIRQFNDKDQKDNPNAPRLADKANHVEEETQARIQSSDTVSQNPSPGSNVRGPADKIGNSEKTKIAQAEEAPGDEKRAPGENVARSRDHSHAAPKPPVPASVAQSSSLNKPGPAAPGGAGASDQAPSKAVVGSLGGAGPAAPELVAADDGFSAEIPEAAPGGTGVGSVPGQFRPAVPGTLAALVPKMPSLGAMGGEAGRLSLPWSGFVNAVGEDALERQRAAAGKKVRSEHAGRYDTNKFERWLPDIVNYDPSVKLGNQTALNAAQSPFATYLSTIHNAIHPIFAEEFLGLLNTLPRGHVLNEHLVTHVEIILSKGEGKVLKMGVTKQSGSTIFDAAALEAIDRAQPFGSAPDVIASSDGNIYLHWEFHRDPVDACSTRNAKPFLVKDPKPLKPSTPLKPKLKPPTKKKEGDAPAGKTAASQPPAAPPAAAAPAGPAAK